jgi:serine/threonine protein kinase
MLSRAEVSGRKIRSGAAAVNSSGRFDSAQSILVPCAGGELVDGRFRLVDQVAAGGMGIVFRALDEHSGSQVAVKVLDFEIDPIRAQREAQILAATAHRSIVRYIADGITPDGRLFVAMEWVEGETAADHIATRGFTASSAAPISRTTARTSSASAPSRIGSQPTPQR